MNTPGPDLLSVLLISMIGLFSLAFGSVLIFIVYQRRMLAKDRELLQRESHYQRELLSAIIESQEMERKRIAHDLHDEIGVLLTTSKLHFNQLSPGNAAEQLKQVSEKMNMLFDEMMQNIRRISHDLRPIILEKLGLIEALESLGAKLEESGIRVHLYTLPLPPISPQGELLLYRIIQELITNTLKHARAQSIRLELEVADNTLYLQYSDDGVGLASAEARGLGMKSIESRLSILGGQIEMKEGKGAHYLLQVPTDKLYDHE